MLKQLTLVKVEDIKFEKDGSVSKLLHLLEDSSSGIRVWVHSASPFSGTDWEKYLNRSLTWSVDPVVKPSGFVSWFILTLPLIDVEKTSVL